MFRRKQVEEMTGIPARRIQFYTEQGLLPMVEKSTGRGREREYSRDDVFRLAIIQEMAEVGIVLSKIKVFLDEDEKRAKWKMPKIVVYERFKAGASECFIYERSTNGGGAEIFSVTSEIKSVLYDDTTIRIIINLAAIFDKINWE